MTASELKKIKQKIGILFDKDIADLTNSQKRLDTRPDLTEENRKNLWLRIERGKSSLLSLKEQIANLTVKEWEAIK